ncbi:protein sip-5 [Stenotrophomonas maltophilia]|uniref:protein sip-5 n=1 Tax=Stenotrophomonas maltophilia TaxID=40324 RepID=UPI0015C55FD3|nr:protein sip-5 [Stenotrophomonas maltophilia]
MKFGALQRRVKRCEQVVTVRLVETQDHWSTLSQVWRQGWSPLRIVVVGLAGGFIAGKLEMPGKVNGARWLQMVGSVSNLFASAQAAFATAMAAQAAATADDAAEEADNASEQAQAAASASTARPAPAPAPAPRPAAEPEPREPRPAEAATELSER